MPHNLKPSWKWTIAGVLIAVLYGLILLNDQRLPWLFAEGQSEDTGVNLRRRIGLTGVQVGTRQPIPTGKGVPFGHVEGNFGDYLPNVNDPAFLGVRMTPRSGDSKVNGHTVFTSRVVYGPAGLAPGVTDVHYFTSSHWLTDAVLKTGTQHAPDHRGLRVFTNSWIGNRNRSLTEILRRTDYLVDQHDVIIVAGVNNGAQTEVPALLASAHNVIAVGLDTGGSSGGYTRVAGKGRCKPDIVAPRGVTSYSTPVVAAIAARLLEAADGMKDAAPNAGRAEVIKAVLLAGAQKPKNWNPEPGKPLDEHFGAGLVRFDHSYSILTAGPTPSGAQTDGDGWGFGQLATADTRTVSLAVRQPMELSAVLVWHRRVSGRKTQELVTGRKRWLATPSTADFDLRLIRVLEDGSTETAAESTSSIDNVEHVYQAALPPGTYTLEVTRKDNKTDDWDYALAWRLTQPAPQEAPSRTVGRVTSQRERSTGGTTARHVPPTHNNARGPG